VHKTHKLVTRSVYWSNGGSVTQLHACETIHCVGKTINDFRMESFIKVRYFKLWACNFLCYSC